MGVPAEAGVAVTVAVSWILPVAPIVIGPAVVDVEVAVATLTVTHSVDLAVPEVLSDEVLNFVLPA